MGEPALRSASQCGRGVTQEAGRHVGRQARGQAGKARQCGRLLMVAKTCFGLFYSDPGIARLITNVQLSGRSCNVRAAQGADFVFSLSCCPGQQLRHGESHIPLRPWQQVQLGVGAVHSDLAVWPPGQASQPSHRPPASPLTCASCSARPARVMAQPSRICAWSGSPEDWEEAQMLMPMACTLRQRDVGGRAGEAGRRAQCVCVCSKWGGVGAQLPNQQGTDNRL